MSALKALFSREFALAFGQGGGPLLAAGFLACAVGLIPLSSGSDPNRLAILAPGLSWLMLALASLLSLERLFERDAEDGALELLAIGPLPLEIMTLIKCLAQYVATGVPLALLTPIAAVALGMDPKLIPLSILTGLVGGLGFACLGGIGAAVSIGARRGGVLIAVIVLPLFSPPVIFGAGALMAEAQGLNPWPGVAFLGAYVLFSLAIAPFAMAAGVKNALS